MIDDAKIHAVVSARIGRRRVIDQGEMAALLEDFARIGLSLANDCILPGRDSPTEWARACCGLTLISVLAHGTTPHGSVRYDEPGSLHPLHHAAVMFVPLPLSQRDETGYLARHCRRLLRVRAGELPEPEAQVPAPERRSECALGHQWHGDEEFCAICGGGWC